MKANCESFCNSMNNTGFPFNIICLMETWYNSFQVNNNFNTVFERTQNEKLKSVITGKFNLKYLRLLNLKYSTEVFEQRLAHFI